MPVVDKPMEVAERIKVVLSGGQPDMIPWTIYSSLLPRGSFERELRGMGLGLNVGCSVYKMTMPNVRVENRTQGDFVYMTYHTPVGEVTTKIRTGLKWQFPGGSAKVEHPIKGVHDIGVMKFMIEDLICEPDYGGYRQAEEELGADGVMTCWAGYTPLTEIIINYMGFRTFALMLMRYPEIIDELVKALDRKLIETLSIIANSPVEIVSVGDNVDGVFISPNLFEKYYYYNKYVGMLKEKGKTVISHMDGRLRVLKNQIAMTKLDAIEAFTPPPMGDLSLKEAKNAWGDKIIWMNYPEEIFLREPEEIRAFTIGLLEEIAPGKGFIIGITEDINPYHFKKGMRIITETLYRYGDLPIRPPL